MDLLWIIVSHFKRIGVQPEKQTFVVLKKNLNASRPSEHPPVRGEKMSKRFCCC